MIGPLGVPIPEVMLCIDPGLATGVAVLGYQPSVGVFRLLSEEDDFATVGETTRDFLQHHRLYGERGLAEVVIERFTITAETVKHSAAPWSLEVIGMVKWLVWEHWGQTAYDRIVLQSPAEAKRLVSNDTLRKADLWHRGGEGHALDALRHGVRRYAAHHVYDPLTTAGVI